MFARSQIVSKIAATSLYGPDLSKWPARIVDAFVVLSMESDKVDSMMIKSDNAS